MSISAAKTLKSDPPRFTPAAAEEIALDDFGIEARAASLNSERDQNFRLTSATGPHYVLKIANAAEVPSAIEFENAILEHLHRVAPDIPVPRIVPSTANENVVVHASEGVNYLVRCLTWLDGTCLDDMKPKPRLHRQLGTELARLGRGLRGLFHPAARKPLLWDLRNLAQLSPWLEDIEDRDLREFCTKFVRHYSEDTVPRLAALRSQVIFNDFHGDNVYVNDESPPKICGIGDFGDSLHGPLICDVAVAAAYQVSSGEDPLEDVIELVQAYHGVTPLEPEGLLMGLVFGAAIGATLMPSRLRSWSVGR
jgi:Ser/Thr protein kinase RdoA (MazF antagonist)